MSSNESNEAHAPSKQLEQDKNTKSATSQKYVTDLLRNDVLLGRGSHLVKYEGNVEFRRLIQERKDDYVSAVRHSHKDEIARGVISSVKSSNGRFLRKVENPNEIKKLNIPIQHVETSWVPADIDIIMEKIKQAFRDSCKDGSTREHPHISHPGNAGVAASDASKATRRSEQIDQDEVDENADDTAAKTSTPVRMNDRQQQEQQLQHLALQQLNSAIESTNTATGDNMNLVAGPDFFGSRHLGDAIGHDVAHSVLQQHLRSDQLDWAIRYEQENLSRVLTRYIPVPSQLPVSQNIMFPTQSSYHQATIGSHSNDLSPSIFFRQQLDASDVLRALQQRQALVQQQLQQQQLPQLIENRNALLAFQQQNTSLLPSLPSSYSTLSLLQQQLALNIRRTDIEAIGLLSGFQNLNYLASQEILMERYSSADRTSVELPQLGLNRNALVSTDRVNDASFDPNAVAATRTEESADSEETTETDANLKRSSDTHDNHDVEDDYSVTPKKKRAERSKCNK